MAERLTQSYVNSIRPNPEKPIWITDSVTQNLKLYVGTSGVKVWYVYYRVNGKKGSHKLGLAGEVLTVAEAREMARDFLARIARGENPKKDDAKKVTLGDFLNNVYGPWVTTNLKSGKATMNMLRSSFGFLFPRPMAELTPMEIERWRTKRSTNDLKGSSINRLMGALQSALNWAVKRSLIEANPLRRLERLPEHDSDEKVRYLLVDERKRLMTTLDARETKMRQQRANYNKWLAERGKDLLPPLTEKYVDYLKPMVLLSLHTGIRRNSIFSMVWGDLDLGKSILTLRASVVKGGKTTRLPLNKVASDVLRHWRSQSENISSDALVFPSPRSGEKMDNCARAWQHLMKDAEIENFRWHDMRHDFASQLVMKGVDLYVVKELMCHSDIRMTQRYAHLAPENKLRAVELLTER